MISGIDQKLVRDRIGDRRVIVSVSGGKDSAATSLHLRELGIEHDRVFADTGWEARETYEYLRGDLARALGPIVEVRAPLQMRALAILKGMFPSRVRKWCTSELKMKPLARHMASFDDEVVSVVGVRAQESKRRAALTEWEFWDDGDCDVWRPLLRWSEREVIEIHKRHGLRPNPLYLLGARRVGCWPCINARKSEIRLIAKHDPARIDELRELETRVYDVALARITRKGETLENPPAWFQRASGRDRGKSEPIDAAVAWSRTARGGLRDDQVELFSAEHDGCARWGMCEPVDESEDAA